MSRPACVLKSSPARCDVVPLPAEAKLSLPGFAGVRISSAVEVAGTFGLTIRIAAISVIRETGVKSRPDRSSACVQAWIDRMRTVGAIEQRVTVRRSARDKLRATLPPAPGLFSMTIGWPGFGHLWHQQPCQVVGAAPAGNGTIRCTGFVGYACQRPPRQMQLPGQVPARRRVCGPPCTRVRCFVS